MKTPAFRSPQRSSSRPRTQDVDQRLAITVARAIWDNSPILLVIDIAIAIACLPALIIAGTGGLVIAPILLAVLVGPVWIAALAAGEAILDGEVVSFRRFASMMRRALRSGVLLALIPGGIATLMLGTLTLAGDNGNRSWMIAPVLVDGLVLSSIVVIGLGASWLVARGADFDRSLWRKGAMIAGSAPQAIGGIVSVAVFIGISVQLIGPLMVVILSAPFAVFVSATLRWVASSRRMDIDA